MVGGRSHGDVDVVIIVRDGGRLDVACLGDGRWRCEIELSDGEGKDGAETRWPPSLGWREGGGIRWGNPMLFGLVCAA